MRRRDAVLVSVLVLAAASPSHANDPRDEARTAITDSGWYEETQSSIPLPFGPEEDATPDISPDDEPVATQLAAALRAATVQLRASAFRVRRAGGAAEALLAGDRAVFDEADLGTVRTAVADGDLQPLATVSLAGSLNAALAGSNREVSPVLPRQDIECAIGIAVAWPHSEERREGLDVRARVAPHTNGDLVVAFHAALSADVVATPVETSTECRDDMRGEAFVAGGSAIVPAAGALCVRGTTPDGNGFVILISARSEGVPRLPARLDEGWVALPLAAACTKLASASGLSDRDTPAQADGLLKWGKPLREPDTPSAHRLVDGLGDGVLWWSPGPAGVAFVQTRAEERDAVLARWVVEHDDPETVTIVVQHPGAGRMVVPALPGDAPRGFVGRLRSQTDGLDVETGCHRCIQVSSWIEMSWEGLAFAAATDPGRLTELDLAVRTAAPPTYRKMAARRIVSTHDRYEYDDFSVCLATAQEMRVRTLLPRGGGALPDGASCALVGQRAVDAVPRSLTVNGEPIYVAPGYSARVLRQSSTPHLLSWEWDGSCAMTYRWPVVHDLASGLDVALRMRGDGAELDVSGTVTGTATATHPAFDMGDGTVAIMRQPYLAVASRVGVGAVRRVAWADELALDVGDPRSDARTPLRTARIDVGDDTYGACFTEGRPVALDAGGAMLVPAEIRHYHSNHSTGEAYVESAPILDGVTLELREHGEMMRGYVDLRTRPELRAYLLHKRETPRRPEASANLLQPSQARHTWPLFVPHGRTLDRTSATGTPPLRVSVAAATAEDEDR